MPLIQAKKQLGPRAKVATLYPSVTDTHGDQPNISSLFMDGSSCPQSTVDTNAQLQLQTPTGENYHPDDELMWQLFNSQLSLDFFESDMFPPDFHMSFP
jgi:hypothetical protein